MSTLVTGVSLGAFEQLPTHARQCTFWVMDPVAADDAHIPDSEFENEAWLSMVMLEWGSCGQLLSVGGTAVGCALYAPPWAVPRSKLFPTSPVSPDAVLLTTLLVESDLDSGYHATLIQAVVADLVNRGVRALEAFGIRSSTEDPTDAGAAADARPSSVGSPGAAGCSPTSCMVDADFLEKVGFEVIQPHHRFPRMRLELDRDHGWKEDVESALERLLIEASVSLLEIDHRVPAGVR